MGLPGPHRFGAFLAPRKKRDEKSGRLQRIVRRPGAETHDVLIGKGLTTGLRPFLMFARLWPSHTSTRIMSLAWRHRTHSSKVFAGIVHFFSEYWAGFRQSKMLLSRFTMPESRSVAPAIARGEVYPREGVVPRMTLGADGDQFPAAATGFVQ